MSQLGDGTRDGERSPSVPIERQTDAKRRDARRFARRIDCAPAPEPRDTHAVEQIAAPER